MSHHRASAADGCRAVALLGGTLYACYACMVFFSPTAISSVVEIGYLPKALYLFFTTGGSIVAFSIACLMFMRARSSIAMSAVVVAALSCSVTGFLVLGIVFQVFPAVSIEGVSAWFFLSGICLGLGNGFMVLLWFRIVSHVGLREMFAALTFCSVAGSVCFYAASKAARPIPWFIACGACLASLAALEWVRRRRGARTWECGPGGSAGLSGFVRPLAGVAIMGLMAGLMMNVVGQELVSLPTYQLTAFVTMFGINALMLVCALAAPRAFSVPRLYKVILPFSAIGFLLLPLAWDALGRSLVNLCVQTGFVLTDAILACLVADAARDGDRKRGALFCMTQIVVMAAYFIGLAVSFFAVGYLEPGGLALTAVALAGVYLIMMAALVLFKDRSLAMGHVRESAASSADAGEGPTAFSQEPAVGVCAAAEPLAAGGDSREIVLLDDSVLSAREREVLIELRHGHAPKAIAKHLYISENTVRFHVKNIYQKLGVHSRSELMELLDVSEKRRFAHDAKK